MQGCARRFKGRPPAVHMQAALKRSRNSAKTKFAADALAGAAGTIIAPVLPFRRADRIRKVDESTEQARLRKTHRPVIPEASAGGG